MRNTYHWVVIVWAVFVLALTAWYLTQSASPEIEDGPQEPVRVIATPPKDILLEAELATADVHKPAAEPVIVQHHSQEDLDALTLVIYQEAGGDACSDETRQLVGEVVLNRVADERFPDTIEEVLTTPRQYGRLHWTGLVWPDRASDPVEEAAVRRAYACAETLLNGTAERILPEDAVWQAEFPQGEEVLVYQDGFYFCK